MNGEFNDKSMCGSDICNVENHLMNVLIECYQLDNK